jgi:hypothetical protein
MDCTHSQPTGNRRVIHYATVRTWMRKGTAADFIQPFHVEPGDKFVLVLRVSTSEQTKHGSLLGQSTHLSKAVRQRGGEVLASLPYEWSGRGITWLEELTDVTQLARRHHATILGATTDRLLRAFWFRGNHLVLWEAQAQRHELQDLEQATLGVPLMTYLHPDATPTACKSLLTTWGQEATGQTGGRPRRPRPGYRQDRRERWQDQVRKLHREGWSVRDTAEHVSQAEGVRISHTAIAKWLSEPPETL